MRRRERDSDSGGGRSRREEGQRARTARPHGSLPLKYSILNTSGPASMEGTCRRCGSCAHPTAQCFLLVHAGAASCVSVNLNVLPSFFEISDGCVRQGPTAARWRRRDNVRRRGPESVEVWCVRVPRQPAASPCREREHAVGHAPPGLPPPAPSTLKMSPIARVPELRLEDRGEERACRCVRVTLKFCSRTSSDWIYFRVHGKCSHTRGVGSCAIRLGPRRA